MAISFSLYGSNPKYCVGAVRNADLARTFYPDWQMVVYHDSTVPLETLKQLALRRVELRQAPLGFPNGMFWRLLIHDDPSCERFIVRDADSRLSQRGKNCVEEWIRSGKALHTMRDHPYHIDLMMCGLTSMITGKAGNMAELARPYAQLKTWGVDQAFLRQVIYLKLRDSFIHHDSCRTGNHQGCIPIPASNEDPRAFLGEVFDEHERPNEQHRDMRAEHLGIK
jgi:hypothetical protein